MHAWAFPFDAWNFSSQKRSSPFLDWANTPHKEQPTFYVSCSIMIIGVEVNPLFSQKALQWTLQWQKKIKMYFHLKFLPNQKIQEDKQNYLLLWKTNLNVYRVKTHPHRGASHVWALWMRLVAWVNKGKKNLWSPHTAWIPYFSIKNFERFLCRVKP